MSLRRKSLLFVVLSVAALVGATLWVVDGLVMRELARVEREETANKVATVGAIVQRCIDEYRESFADWTEWDDLAQYLADGNQGFVDSNVSLAALADQIHADFFIVERNDGTLVCAEQVNAARKGLEPCTPEILANLTPRGLMRAGKGFSGLLAFPDRTYMVSSRPIHKTDGSDPEVEGRLVTGARIDDAWVQRLEGFTSLELQFRRTAETPFEEEELAAREALARGTDSFVADSQPERISGYGLLQDVYGKPALVLRLSTGRKVRLSGEQIVSWTMLTLLSGGLVLCLVAMWATGKGALEPLQRLLAGTHKLRQGERTHVIVHSGDEFEELAHDFNRMSDAIFEREEAITSAHQELARLFDGMAEAIVAFGPDGKVSGRASRKAHEVFARAELAGLSLSELLYPGADEFEIEAEAFQAWLSVAFTQTTESWPQLCELAPKTVVLRAGRPDEVHLALSFRAIELEGRVHRVILLATDETEKHSLLREQAERESAHERQLQTMRKLLAGGAQLFVDFVRSSRERLDEIEIALQRRAGRLETADVELLFRHAHTLKGEARVFDIQQLELHCREFEALLSGLREEARAGSAQAGPRLARLGELLAAARCALEEAQEFFVRASPIGTAILDQMSVRRSDVAELDQLSRSLAQAGGSPLVWALCDLVERLHARPFGEICSAFSDSLSRWADRLGKHAVLEVEGHGVPIPPELARRLPGVLTHLLRNAISHGIEPPGRREGLGKSSAGKVRVTATSAELGPRITVEDDGAGLDLVALAARARELGLPAPQGEEWRLVFVAGLSTARVSDEYSGRGVGMGAVQSDLALAGYEVELCSEAGKFTRVTLRRSTCSLQSNPLAQSAAGGSA